MVHCGSIWAIPVFISNLRVVARGIGSLKVSLRDLSYPKLEPPRLAIVGDAQTYMRTILPEKSASATVCGYWDLLGGSIVVVGIITWTGSI